MAAYDAKVTSPEIWREFANDPRSPAYASMRAADADRDVVLRALGEAYAEGRLDAAEFDERSTAVQKARTLGQLPAFLADLVPPSNVAPYPVAPYSAMPAPQPEQVEAEAVAKWERSRREALTTWVTVSMICWVVWAATNFGGFPWPVFPMAGTAIPLIAVMIQRESGGNLAELLDNISAIVRARLKLLGEVRTLSAEGRLSAWILGALPFCVAAVIQLVNPGFMAVLWTDPIGLRMVGGALLLMAVGVWWMRKIIRIRV